MCADGTGVIYVNEKGKQKYGYGTERTLRDARMRYENAQVWWNGYAQRRREGAGRSGTTRWRVCGVQAGLHV
jgi:hypothetical protein